MDIATETKMHRQLEMKKAKHKILVVRADIMLDLDAFFYLLVSISFSLPGAAVLFSKTLDQSQVCLLKLAEAFRKLWGVSRR